MQLYQHFVINPEKYRVPQYSISPFSNEWVRENYKISKSNAIDENLLTQYFGDFDCFENGKAALFHALSHYNLSQDDEVYIVTTTGNRYISSCVTGEIEKYCKWSRQLSDKTKVILVNHEFGVVHRSMDEILKLRLPIIEDMAMSLFSTDEKQQTGRYGDFTIFSLPKFFPIQWGGILKRNHSIYQNKSLPVRADSTLHLQKLLSYYLKDVDAIKKVRKRNNALFQEFFSQMGFNNRFKYSDVETPSVFMCSTPPSVDLDGLKIFLQQNGIEAGVFYGESAFFVPIHQNLRDEDVLYIVSLIKYFCYDNK